MAGDGIQPLNIFLIIFPFILSFIIVTIRVWRRIKARQFAIENTLIVVAELLLAAITATFWKLVLVSHTGYHAEDIPRGAVDMEQVMLWRYISNAVYSPILGIVKISFLITLLKLRSMNRLIITSLWALIVVNIMFIIASTVGTIFMCQPIKRYWHRDKPSTCPNIAQYISGVIGVTIATDVLVSLTPAWILYDLRMSLRHKTAVIVFLSLTLAITGIGCYRLHRFVIFFSLPTQAAEDPYNVRNALSNIEANLGVITACGPTVKWILSNFITYFDTTPSSPFTPDLSPFPRRCSRGYQKNYGDVKLQPEGLHSGNSQDVCKSYSKSSDNDSDTGKQCVAVGLGKDTVRTSVVGRTSADTAIQDS